MMLSCIFSYLVILLSSNTDLTLKASLLTLRQLNKMALGTGNSFIYRK